MIVENPFNIVCKQILTEQCIRLMLKQDNGGSIMFLSSVALKMVLSDFKSGYTEYVGGNFYRLKFNTNKLNWILEAVDEDNPAY